MSTYWYCIVIQTIHQSVIKVYKVELNVLLLLFLTLIVSEHQVHQEKPVLAGNHFVLAIW